MLLIEGAMLEPRTQVSGAVLIVDLEGMSLQHVIQFSPNFAKMLLEWVQVSTHPPHNIAYLTST